MSRSLRWRIQLWHGGILLAVVAAFAGLLYARLHRTRFAEVESELRGGADVLVSVLRVHAPREAERRLQRGPGRADLNRPRPPEDRPDRNAPPPADRESDGAPPPAEGERGPGFRPPRPPADMQRRLNRLQEELQLPPSLRRREVEPDEIAPYLIIWQRSGEVLKASPAAPARIAPVSDEFGRPASPVFRRRGEVYEVAMAAPGGMRLVVGRSIRGELAELRQWLLVLVASGAALLVLGLVGGLVLTGRALRPLRAMSDTAAAISASNLSRRIDAGAIDRELADLASTLNAAFARLEEDFARQARFTADASHELRTPLAILLGHLELALARARRGDDHTEALETCQRAGRRMKSLVEGLLLLARADAGKLEPARRPFDMSATVEECVELLQPLAEQRGVELAADVSAAEAAGDPRLIAQVVVNLVQNALQHTPAGGRVLVEVRRRPQEVELCVVDSGEGISPDHRERIFERFYRADEARARESGGVGLGLAIAHSLVAAHGGQIVCESEVGRGTRFTVRLPAGETSNRLEDASGPPEQLEPSRALPH